MKKIVLNLALLCVIFVSQAQNNLELLSILNYQDLHGSDLSDIWGYADEEGNEYAIVGVNNGGVSIVDVTDPMNPFEVFFSPGPSTIWRDMKTWGDYAYITNESSGGLKIIDMSGLPDNTNLPVVQYDLGNWQSAHNLYIDEFGYCYIAGANRGNGGVIFLDLNDDPMNPVEVGEYDQFYVHDVVAKENLMYLSHISDGFFQILDVTDKTNPIVLGSQETSSTFTHNAWFSDDLNYLFTTDEVPNSFIDSYDISDPTDIQFLDNIQSSPGDNVIVHNTHYIDGFLVTSYYRDGVTIHDVSNPDIMVEIGNYDTSPNFNGNGFNGCWGVYPWLPSGNIIAADIEEGLYVLGPNYIKGCYLVGEVTDASNNAPINDADLQLVATSISDNSDAIGTYGMGIAESGTYSLEVSKPGYLSQTITDIELTNGNTVEVDIELVPLQAFSFSGTTLEAENNGNLSGTEVIMFNTDFTFSGTSDGNGNFTFPNIFPGTYDIIAGQWGFITECIEGVEINESNNTVVLTLEEGIYDDFSFDFGWTSSATSPTGQWERAEPFGTTAFGNNQVNPEVDVQGDCYNQCYVTGNAASDQAGADDVDDGNVILVSPTFDATQFVFPRVSFWRWFANYDNTIADDQLELRISNGTDEEILAVYDENDNMSEWVFEEFILSDIIELSTIMTLIVETSDNFDNGSLVEAGIDLFQVYEGPVSISEINENAISIFPNPSNGEFQIQTGINEQMDLRILDTSGRLILQDQFVNFIDYNLDISPGLYHVLIETQSGARIQKKMLVK